MKTKIDITKHITTGMGRAMLALSGEVEKNMDRRLFELVKIRASQLNQCAYCLDMHTKDARRLGETEQRIYALSAWRETPFFTDRERAALEWTEALTRLSHAHPTEELRARLATYFDEDEIVALTFAVVVINSWNRLVVPVPSTDRQLSAAGCRLDPVVIPISWLSHDGRESSTRSGRASWSPSASPGSQTRCRELWNHLWGSSKLSFAAGVYRKAETGSGGFCQT